MHLDADKEYLFRQHPIPLQESADRRYEDLI